MLFEIINDAAWGADQQIDASGDVIALLFIAGTTVSQTQSEPGMFADSECVFVDLDRQLAGRCQQQRAGLVEFACVSRRLFQQAVETGDQKGGSFAGAGLCFTRDIFAF